MSQFSSQLIALLHHDSNDLKQLNELLDQEIEALESRNISLTETLSKSKAQLINQLESRAKDKANLLAHSGLDVAPGKVEPALKQLGDDALLECWHNVRKLMAECKDKNQINGNVINHSLQRTNRLMTIIRGQNNAPSLYGQGGAEKNISSSTCIGKA
jgi:flagellar biosynthesis/type III secretory pathway chaperone